MCRCSTYLARVNSNQRGFGRPCYRVTVFRSRLSVPLRSRLSSGAESTAFFSASPSLSLSLSLYVHGVPYAYHVSNSYSIFSSFSHFASLFNSPLIPSNNPTRIHSISREMTQRLEHIWKTLHPAAAAAAAAAASGEGASATGHRDNTASSAVSASQRRRAAGAGSANAASAAASARSQGGRPPVGQTQSSLRHPVDVCL